MKRNWRGMLFLTILVMAPLTTHASYYIDFSYGYPGWTRGPDTQDTDVMPVFQGVALDDTLYTPLWGSMMLQLRAGVPGLDVNGDGKAGQTELISPHLSIAAGSMLSMEAAFLGHDVEPFDDSMGLTFRNELFPSDPRTNGDLVLASITGSGAVFEAGNYGDVSFWYNFQFPTAFEGHVTIWCRNVGDDENDSIALTDLFKVSDPRPPVPEPGTMVLLGSGLLGLAGWGRRRCIKRE